MQELLAEIAENNRKAAAAFDKLLNKFTTSKKISFPTIKLLPNKDQYIVRARQLEKEADYFTKIADFSYNPDSRLITQGRMNKPHQIVFYARSNFEGTLAECQFLGGKNNGEQVSFSFSKWQLTKALKFIIIINPEDIDLKKDRKDYVSQYAVSYKEWIENKEDSYLNILKFMANKLRAPILPNEKYKYKYTAALANMLLNSEQDLGGIIYQSVQFKNQYNFAIKKRYIDENYFVPIQFSKGTYQINNDSLIELAFQEAKSFDNKTGNINW